LTVRLSPARIRLHPPGPPARRRLLEQAGRCETAAAELDLGRDGAARAREILLEYAACCRQAARAFDADPTLDAAEDLTGWYRGVDLLAEVARQLIPLLHHCLSDRHLERWPRAVRWEEAEALHALAVARAARVAARLPRADHATPAGSARISRRRLAARAGPLRKAEQAIRDALPAPDALPYPAEEIAELAALADTLARHVQALEQVAAQTGAEIDAMLSLHPDGDGGNGR